MKETIAIILAAGQGTRMKSNIPKVLHKVCGKTLIDHVLDNCQQASVEQKFIIVGHKHEEVKGSLGEKAQYILQEEQLGTGHAMMQAKEVLEKNRDSNVIVLMGDAPLISSSTIKKIIHAHNTKKNNATVLTATSKNPHGYGRIVRDHEENLLKIVEQKDASDREIKIDEINSGVYCFNGGDLLLALDEIKNDNVQGEYYLTDVIEIMKNSGLKVGVFTTSEEDIKAVNSRIELAGVEKIMKTRINEKLMDQGVTFIDPEHTYIGSDVSIGTDTIVYPGVIIEGKTSIGNNCVIHANSRIKDCIIDNEVEIDNSTVLASKVMNNAKIGPYAYVRPNCIIGERVKIGDFVEVKNSTIGNDTKASHLTYIGDAKVGDRVNLGCGVVFVNYDGQYKHETIVEDDCFVGCNVNLIAPANVKKGSYVAAGSTITESVEENSLAIARCRQVNKKNYNKKFEL
ncbi:bifunctional UDP-N-acetylglucosamine diphosphorylase/glucosamine-1-phosphate N-acetyltransferase GlmU [Alkalibaculum sp. M08DMB]|uniref:Bifunctional protein GlmU n=1 Tax=Alkalibaculum sporogenes TaxID=2655001 RepID=A0A6A7K6C4_9FIRM|nr:bifunctional UDP-N-acetylglucosamine diphosphorylase/glucosamine-1-phosphate N-acetyltransferase GlmU [Alkalibaculum sporogenes]MPW24976.1 bifunctional UDP-N-acetylglucosamine diphosphorylase/glucosamine-1-phosphate N-acetyltransferase GlmU [Alkalibaculum sporogenes]